ncbi:MAG: asparagine synthase (glutamine-hydrolyzing) [Phycisphaerales bacterium]|nr:asparagine synthase (glutamine-hydrolyzing) [Phycisphaerales bacterium]
MCGIAGIVSDRTLDPDDRFVVAAMLDRLHQRGPDGRGMVTRRTAVLGHTRLAIVSPADGHQPIANENGTVWMVANGQIYNHVPLRDELESGGHHFSTASDCEVILHLYEEVGVACVDRLRGMFAFAIWDEPRRTLLLARDPIGVKPLYYAALDGSILFASRLDALMLHPQLGRDIDLAAVHEYLTYHYVPSPRTILRGVRKLEPGQRLVVRDGIHNAQTYWDLSMRADATRTDDEWMALIRDGIQSAVETHMMADVPVGAFLSGGIDSAAVVAAMSRSAAGPVPTHTIGFSETMYDERAGARETAIRLGTDHVDCLMTPDPTQLIEQLVDCFDEPFADPSAIPTYYVSEMARNRVKAVLSGDGGDELFAGYTRYLRHERERIARRFLAGDWTGRFVRACADVAGPRVRGFAEQLTGDDDFAHYLNVAWFSPDETLALFGGDALPALGGHDPFGVLAGHFNRCDAEGALRRGQYVDIKTWLADGVLCKTDRAAMANGLEVRVPLLDIPFVTTMATLPDHLKIDHGRGKFALRRAVEPWLGRTIVNRRKRGFEAPLDAWIMGPFRHVVQDTLCVSSARIHEWLAPSAIDDVWTQLNGGRRGMGSRVWALLMLELWLQRVASIAPVVRERGIKTTSGVAAALA